MKKKRPNKKNRNRQRLKISRDAVVSNEDLLTEILLHVPAKSLVRFLCVSKCWLSLISDPLFCSNYARQNSNFSASLLISEKNIEKIFRYLLCTGVCFVKKDFRLKKHTDIDVPNLEVIVLMQSLKSKEYVTEDSSRFYHHWYLTNDGTKFMRRKLSLLRFLYQQSA